jgi:hypothetical protein
MTRPSLQSNPERERKVVRLVEYVRGCVDGQELHWPTIATATKIEMDIKGRDLFRTACRREKRPYETIIGIGVRLSSPETTVSIMGERAKRLRRGIRSAERVHKQLMARHGDKLDQRSKATMTTARIGFETIRAFESEAMERLFSASTDPAKAIPPPPQARAVNQAKTAMQDLIRGLFDSLSPT